MAASPPSSPSGERQLGRPGAALAGLAPVLVLAGGFASRLARARGSFLNPDEALHNLLASQPTLGLAWRAALTNAHPPLLILVLHYWRMLGQSELMLRLPLVLAGTAACWFAYRWLAQLTDRSTALIGLLLFCFAPGLVELSAAVRQYALLLFFMSCCLYLAERAVQQASPAAMILFSLSLLGALLSHYSALIFAFALGVYMLVRLYPYGKNRRLFTAWLGGQAVALAVAGYFLLTHVAQLRQAGMPQGIAAGYLHQSLYQPGDNAALFLATQTVRVFTFILGRRIGGVPALLAFLVAIVALLRRSSDREGAPASAGEKATSAIAGEPGAGPPERGHEKAPPRPYELALLLGLPFVISCGAALTRLYPYGGTRHSVYLALFALGGACLGLPAVQPAREWTRLLPVAGCLALCTFAFSARSPAIPSQASVLMQQAVDAVHASAPPGSILFADYQSGLLLGYYVCGHGVVQVFPPLRPFARSACGPYTVITTFPQVWSLEAGELRGELGRLAQLYRLAPGMKIWWFDAGWIEGSAPNLRRELLRIGWSPVHAFGANILLCQLTVGGSAPGQAVPASPPAGSTGSSSRSLRLQLRTAVDRASVLKARGGSQSRIENPAQLRSARSKVQVVVAPKACALAPIR
jgi:Dolichyl-phosphate-mannose-protein mannosyltransferase